MQYVDGCPNWLRTRGAYLQLLCTEAWFVVVVVVVDVVSSPLLDGASVTVVAVDSSSSVVDETVELPPVELSLVAIRVRVSFQLGALVAVTPQSIPWRSRSRCLASSKRIFR